MSIISKFLRQLVVLMMILSILGCSVENENQGERDSNRDNSQNESKGEFVDLPEDIRTALTNNLRALQSYETSDTGEYVISMKPKIVCDDNYSDYDEITFWLEIRYSIVLKKPKLIAYAFRSRDFGRPLDSTDLIYMDPPSKIRLINGIDGSYDFYIDDYEDSRPSPCLEVNGSNRPNVFVRTEGTLSIEESAILRRTLAGPTISFGFGYGLDIIVATDSISERREERKKALAILAVYQTLNEFGVDPREYIREG